VHRRQRHRKSRLRIHRRIQRKGLQRVAIKRNPTSLSRKRTIMRPLNF
jgi:hypothetical protein